MENVRTFPSESVRSSRFHDVQRAKNDGHLSPSPSASSDKHAPLLPGIKAHGWYPSFCHWTNNASWAAVQ